MKLLCKIIGHKRDAMRACCSRCERTDEDIEKAEWLAEQHKRVKRGELEDMLLEQFKRGLGYSAAVHTAGIKRERKRAYRVGFMRGGRDVFNRLIDGFKNYCPECGSLAGKHDDRCSRREDEHRGDTTDG